MKFCSFASGSSGNCYYVGTDDYGILIDAGISIKAIKKNLKQMGLGLEKIMAVFVTHDHYDHIRSASILGEVYHIPVYSTQEVLNGINRCFKITEKLYHNRHEQIKGTTVELFGFSVTSFPVYHDSTDCVGYYVEYGHDSLVLVTDLGYVNEEAIPYLIKAENLVIEANYDEKMLMEGSYPIYLKKRILGQSGHLANHRTMTFLAQNHQEHWKNIFFCHLSKNNNSPECVTTAFASAYEANAVAPSDALNLLPLPRLTPTELFDL